MLARVLAITITTLCLLLPFRGASAWSTSLVGKQRVFSSHLTASFSTTRLKMSAIVNDEPVEHLAKELLPDGFIPQRTRILSSADKKDSEAPSAVYYWMQRDVRTVDNWALVLAAHLAATRKQQLKVVYALPPPPPSTSSSNDTQDHPPALVNLPWTVRHADFALGGLECVHQELAQHGIPLHVVQADSHETVGKTVCEEILPKASLVVSDFSPLREFREWMEVQAKPLLEEAQVPFYQVDAHNVVPVWTAADKRQVGARTLRPRIHKVVTDYLQEYPVLSDFDLKHNDKKGKDLPKFNRKAYEGYLKLDESVAPVDWAKPGTAAGMKQFELFCRNGLPKYDELRNDPNEPNACSNLSPWINHGHISFQTLSRKIRQTTKHAKGCASFVEEGLVRRELSDNYVYYTPDDYDQLTAAAGWAQESLALHASDEREYVYSLQQLEEGNTHDDLWNAAQLQVVRDGGMHGFMRMYWAKKILEWTESPQVALKTAQYFNDKYALDGRDPNGFTGVGWSIMGIHDQGWKEREVFGKIRFMNYNGCKRKFKIPAFVQRYPGAAEHAVEASGNNGTSKRAAAPSVAKKTKKARK